MRRIKESAVNRNTIFALCLIPLSGFAMDIFIPSLPDMAVKLHASKSAIQLTLSTFMISYGLSQLLVGPVIDSYGRYVPNLVSMFVFSVASFTIAATNDIHVIYWMRALQGLTVAIIVVSKRAYFLDMFEGEKLKKYTSLFSVIWAIAPIVAPFIGGFLQMYWGWTSNFSFLGYFGIAFFIIDLIGGGESLKVAQPFAIRNIVRSYGTMLRTRDFTAGLMILGLSYAMLLVYGMASPFLIEDKLHYSATVTGYCSLLSGVSVLIGGTISRVMIARPFYKKLMIANTLQIISVVILIPLTMIHQNIFTLLLYVFLVHSLSGFTFNNFFSYCLIRFPEHGGKAGGLVGGGFSLVTAVFSSILVTTIKISSQSQLGIAYGILCLMVFGLLLKVKWKDASPIKSSGTHVSESAPLKQETSKVMR